MYNKHVCYSIAVARRIILGDLVGSINLTNLMFTRSFTTWISHGARINPKLNGFYLRSSAYKSYVCVSVYAQRWVGMLHCISSTTLISLIHPELKSILLLMESTSTFSIMRRSMVIVEESPLRPLNTAEVKRLRSCIVLGNHPRSI